MKTLIPIPELPNVYVVKVELTADDFNVTGNSLIYDPNPNNASELYDIVDVGFDFQLLGFVTKDEISFDVDPYVECFSRELGHYRNYTIKAQITQTIKQNAVDSFRSALASEEITFVNPFGETKPMSFDEYAMECQTWQTAEDNLAQKLVVLIKK